MQISLKLKVWLAAVVLLGTTRAPAAETNAAPDLTKQRVVYLIGYSHLDTQWRWTYPQVIREFIPKTVDDNVALFKKYPDYIFNWTGANRYRLMKEYLPDEFAKVREWVAKGRWFPAGSSWEENDVNLPAAESIIRQLLFGHDFFKKEFGTESDEYMLPDCFGFPASLPSILAHCGLRGFSTQKLQWNCAVGIPFDIGAWEGPDGESVIAAFNPISYGFRIPGDMSTSLALLQRVNGHGVQDGIFADYIYFGQGDTGGAPDEQSVFYAEQSAKSTNVLHVFSARSDQMFRDITDAQMAKLPKYKGDLLLVEHSAGSITSQAYMKRWNRKNELLADAAERAAVAASVLGAAPYPREKLHRAWELVLGGEFHDLLPGTAVPKAFEYTWNDEIIAMNSFAAVLQDSVGAVTRGLDTRAEGTPLVVYNPLSVAREDVVEAELEFTNLPAALTVSDGEGRAVPSQLLSTNANKCRFLFLAKAPPVGFAVYSVKSQVEDSKAVPLTVTERSLENEHYRVTLNDAGDIVGVFDKLAKRELLSAPARLAFQTEFPAADPNFRMQFSAWNMDWKDRTNPPRGYLAGAAKFRIAERGPVRVAVEVKRESENSIFTQTIRLAAGGAGERVEIANDVDWQSKTCSLKADFPLTVSNFMATYNWDLGKIQRGNNDPKKFEVPSHQWFDLTDTKGDYGVSILTDTKYGSDKPADNDLRLTLLYTPGVYGPYYEQRWQDWGRHEFVYGIYGHSNDWRGAKSDWQAGRLGQPLIAFRTAPHDGKLGRSFSLLHLDSDQVAVRAIKMAEDGDQVIVRLQELNGTPAKTLAVTTPGGLTNVTEVTGLEKPLHPVDSADGGLKLDFKPYQLRSLTLTLLPAAKLATPVSTPVAIPYNLDAISFAGTKGGGAFDDAGRTLPAEMINDVVVSEGIKFQIGPRGRGQSNAVVCHGQKIELPAGPHNRVYLLAAAVGGDTQGEFKVDDRAVTVPVQDWGGYIGQWDNRVFKGVVPEESYVVTNDLDHIDAGFIKRDSLGWFASHRHLANGADDIYKYSYLFKYGLDVRDDSKTLTLPDNPRIRVIAVTVAQDDNDATVPLQPLYDDFTGRKPVEMRAGR
jgi:alpha-mannosidase